MASVVVTLPVLTSYYIKTESDDFLLAENSDFLITEGQQGVQSFVLLGNAAGKASAGAPVTGVQTTSALGSVSVVGTAVAFVTGVQATGVVGNLRVTWSSVITTQNPNWVQIVT